MQKLRHCLPQHLLIQLEQHQQITLRVRSLLPVEIAPHIQVARADKTSLFLICTSAAWGSRLRFLQQQLLSQLQAEWPKLELINLQLAPNTSEIVRPAAKRPFSRKAGEIIQQLANAIEDTELSEALARLAKRSKTTRN
ncbi:MAG: DUF721 domain-containing protein [Gammaproteobacteria bacterium]|nr:DUF721 domain-containing protein [Gammaproteobacteria bacterium]